VKHAFEGGSDRAADCQRAVVAQQHRVLIAEISLQARALVMVERNAFVLVICQIMGYELRGLVRRQQALHAASDCCAIGRVQMKHAAGIFPHLMNGRMDSEAGRINDVGALC